jgi:MSHA pilin protein MshA
MQNMIPNRKEKGFTLIELVMVIVILGILAAFALPRFADLGGDARTSVLEGAAGAMKSASAIAHSAQLAKGLAKGAAVKIEGSDVDMVNRYPAATSTGIVRAANIDAYDSTSTANPAPTGDFKYTETTGSPNTITLVPTSYTGSGTCEVVYSESDGTAPSSVSVDKTGC